MGRSVRHMADLLGRLHTMVVVSLSERGHRHIHHGLQTGFYIFSAIGEFERDLNSERTKSGMAAAKKRGVHVGRPRKV